MSSADAYPLSAIAVWWNRVTGRRGHPRHVVSSEPRGELCLFEIVRVLWLHTPEVSVLSKEEHREGELLGVSLPEQDAWIPAKVLSSAPLRAGDSLRHRVRLCIAGTDWGSATPPTSSMREWHTTTDTAVNAVISKTLPIRLLNIGVSGCLLEASRLPRVPAIAELGLVLGGRKRHDLVRVCWTASGCTPTGPFHVGAEFIPVRTQQASIHQALSTIVEHGARGPRLAVVRDRGQAAEPPDARGGASQEKTAPPCDDRRARQSSGQVAGMPQPC